MPTSQETNKRIRLTARVREGLARVLQCAIADSETISTDGGGYRAHGMKKADWNAYLDAIEWIRQQLERRK